MKNLFVAVSLLLVAQLGMSQVNKQAYSVSYPRFIKDASRTPRGQAQGLFRRYFSMGPEDVLRPVQSQDDHLGFTHDQYQQYYKNVKNK